MFQITVVTDTDASLPQEIADQYHIIQVPITIHFGDETFETGVDIDDASLFDRVDREGRLPTTSAPSPGKFAQAFQSAFDAGSDSVVCFCVSSKVSATFGAAVAARESLADRDITVVDTLSLSMGQGFIVLAAAQAAVSGASKEEIISIAHDVGKRSHLYAALSTLKYLAMSGRVGHLAAGMATLLNVKPILTIQDGKLDLLERVRTNRKAWDRVIKLTELSVDGKTIESMAVVHVAAAEQAKAFEGLLRSNLPCPDEILITELTPGLSVHSGAGMVGVGVVSGK